MSVSGTSSLGASMGPDFFMKLLITQLQNQDPMEPMSNSEMIAQMTQLATVEGVNSLNQSFRDVLKLHRLLSGTELLGKQVEYMAGEALRTGMVDAVSTTDGTIRLIVDGNEVGLESLRKIL